MMLVAVAVYLVEAASIRASIDENLRDDLDAARTLVAGTEQKPKQWITSVDALEDVIGRLSPDTNTGLAGTVDGEVRYVPGVQLDVDLTEDPDFIPAVLSHASDSSPVLATYTERHVELRYLVVPIVVEGETKPAEVYLVCAYDVEAELDRINEPARVFVAAAVVMIVLIALVAMLAAERLLRPLRQMRETADRITAQSLTERIPVEGRDDVSELAATMNSMLDRLDEALNSQQQLLHDVGHELRTPVTIIRGHLELMNPGDRDEVAETQRLVIDELDRMSSLVNDIFDAASLRSSELVTRSPPTWQTCSTGWSPTDVRSWAGRSNSRMRCRWWRISILTASPRRCCN